MRSKAAKFAIALFLTLGASPALSWKSYDFQTTFQEAASKVCNYEPYAVQRSWKEGDASMYIVSCPRTRSEYQLKCFASPDQLLRTMYECHESKLQ